MERIQYLIDTNVAIDYLGKKLPVAGLVHGLTLLTRNTADFKNISDLLLVDPHKL
jgi:predicted nucleic acid-binding protein